MNFYRPLEELYSELEGKLIFVDGNPCGECNSCCTATHMGKHKVSELELAYLERQVGTAQTDRFRAYLSRERKGNGKLLYSVCPNYQEGQCSVHQYRPYSCRVYGQYRTDVEPLVDHCVFKPTVKVIPKEQENKLLPLNPKLTSLITNFCLVHPEHLPESKIPPSLNESSGAVSRASYYLSESNFSDARQSLESIPEEEQDGLSFWMLAQAQEGCGDLSEADRYYRKAIEMEPGHPQFQFYLGNLMLTLQRYEEAEHFLNNALVINPQLFLAAGLLGFVRTQLGRLESAIEAYELCLSTEAEPSIFRIQLGTLYAQVSRLEEAKILLEAAQECPSTAVEAGRALSNLTEFLAKSSSADADGSSSRGSI